MTLGPIVLACDGGYAMPLSTALRSLVEANRRWWPVDLSVFVADFPENLRRRVLASLPGGSATIRWIPADLGQFRDVFTPTAASKINYARLHIPDAFPGAISRVLYLDADLLVLADLSPLWEVDLGPAAVGAVLDQLDSLVKQDQPGLGDMPRVKSYFNAGVMLIDLPNWRAQHVFSNAMEYLKRNPRPRYSDQDALNVACDKSWQALDRRWNFIDNVGRIDLAALAPVLRPAIFHFATWNKPWDFRYPNPNAAFYDDFRARTLFARSPLDRRRDMLKRNWTESKQILKHLMPLRAIRDQGNV
jgi:lipopolysaccharide biosynthesis glycosyltransferase